MTMSAETLQQFYAAMAPWLALSLLLLGRNPFLSRVRMVGSLLLAFFLLRFPVEGWSMFAWIRMVEPNPSFTLTGLLGVLLYERLSGKKIFRPEDWNAAWLVGTLTALLLYPMGLGLTHVDPYAWGWKSAFPYAIAGCAMYLLLWGNRFGIILILPLVGSLLHLQESTNLWDALIDPIYGAVSLVAVMMAMHDFSGKLSSAGQASPSGRDGE